MPEEIMDSIRMIDVTMPEPQCSGIAVRMLLAFQLLIRLAASQSKLHRN